MARFVSVQGLPEEYEVACTSDWHCGSRAFHEGALDALIAWTMDRPNRFIGFGGDAIEGKRIDSPHFDPEGLNPATINIDSQFRWVRKKLEPVKKRIKWWGKGNHDIYVSRDVDMVRAFCEALGIENVMGDYQTWVDMGRYRVHVYHGRASMPRGAKDPIQKDANQRAWLVNLLRPLAGDCLVHLMGHVHALLVQQPIESYALLCQGEDVRARYFVEPTQDVTTRDHAGNTDTRRFIPPGSRWYGCTGTLRRSGGFGWTDYAEIAGYPPTPIGWLKMTVAGGLPVALDKVVV